MKKLILLSNLKPGMITAEDVYSHSGQLILAKGLPLTDQTITRLDSYSIMAVKIEEAEKAPEPDTVKQSYSERVKKSPEFLEFKSNFDATLTEFKDSINDIVQKGSPINTDAILEDTLSLINNSHGHISIFDMLQNMRQYDDLTYAHCLNVGLICNVFAGWLHMNEEDTKLATLCGVFHDIGKLSIPDSIVKKPDKLTDQEYNLIKTHTIEGFRTLRDQDIDEHIKNSALMHHERCDGKGYPFGLPSDKIDEFAKIVAIADVYDAMTAARVYRGALCPFRVIEIYEKEGLQRYDARYILTFLENVVLTYLNNEVRLSDGRVGKIVFVNKNHLSKPTIQLEDGTFLDLSKESDLSIDTIL